MLLGQSNDDEAGAVVGIVLDRRLEHLPDLGDAHQRLALQVWIRGRLGVHSANAANAPLAPFRKGFADVRFDGKAWRVYVTRSRDGAWVQVGVSDYSAFYSYLDFSLAPVPVAIRRSNPRRFTTVRTPARNAT